MVKELHQFLARIQFEGPILRSHFEISFYDLISRWPSSKRARGRKGKHQPRKTRKARTVRQEAILFFRVVRDFRGSLLRRHLYEPRKTRKARTVRQEAILFFRVVRDFRGSLLQIGRAHV